MPRLVLPHRLQIRCFPLRSSFALQLRGYGLDGRPSWLLASCAFAQEAFVFVDSEFARIKNLSFGKDAVWARFLPKLGVCPWLNVPQLWSSL